MYSLHNDKENHSLRSCAKQGHQFRAVAGAYLIGRVLKMCSWTCSCSFELTKGKRTLWSCCDSRWVCAHPEENIPIFTPGQTSIFKYWASREGNFLCSKGNSSWYKSDAKRANNKCVCFYYLDPGHIISDVMLGNRKILLKNSKSSFCFSPLCQLSG